MGGDRETFLEGKTPGPTTEVSGSVAAGGGGRLRIHQAGGEVHFHDDANHLKASVPVAEWWKGWDTLSKATELQQKEWDYTDPINNTLLKVVTTVNTATTPKKLEAYITLESVEVGTNFRELQQFTKRR